MNVVSITDECSIYNYIVRVAAIVAIAGRMYWVFTIKNPVAMA